jgi:fibronectin type 3 domain-containing protein
VFLARLDPDGSVVWVRKASSTMGSTVTAMDADSQGNTYFYGVTSYKKGEFNGHKVKGPFVAKTNKDGETEWIEDAVTRTMTSKTTINYPCGLAVNPDEDRIFTTGNATRVTIEYTDFQGSTATTTETIIAVSKIKNE